MKRTCSWSTLRGTLRTLHERTTAASSAARSCSSVLIDGHHDRIGCRCDSGLEPAGLNARRASWPLHGDRGLPPHARFATCAVAEDAFGARHLRVRRRASVSLTWIEGRRSVSRRLLRPAWQYPDVFIRRIAQQTALPLIIPSGRRRAL